MDHLFIKYAVLYIIFLLFIIKEIKSPFKTDSLKLWLFFTILILFLIFIDKFQTVSDLYHYTRYFNNILKAENYDKLLDAYEIGYVLLNILLSKISSNAIILYISSYSIIIYFHIKAYSNHSPFPIFSLFYFFCNTYVGAVLRQEIAASIFIFSFQFIVNKDFKRFLVCFFLAFLFHKVSILMLPIYFLSRGKLSINTYIIILISAIIIGGLIDWHHIFKNIFIYFDRTEYLEFNEKSIRLGFTPGMMERLIIFLISLYYLSISKYNYKYKLIFNIYFVAVIVYFLFNSITVLAVRVSEFLIVFQYILVPYWFYLSKNRINKILLFVLIIAFNGYILSREINKRNLIIENNIKQLEKHTIW